MKLRQLGAAEVTPDSKLLVTVAEVAAMLSIGRTAAWELIWTQKIKSVKIGRTRRVPIVSVREYVGQLLESEVAV